MEKVEKKLMEFPLTFTKIHMIIFIINILNYKNRNYFLNILYLFLLGILIVFLLSAVHLNVIYDNKHQNLVMLSFAAIIMLYWIWIILKSSLNNEIDFVQKMFNFILEMYSFSIKVFLLKNFIYVDYHSK